MTIVRKVITWGPVLVALNSAVVGIARVQGKSMQPTLNPEGSNFSDYVLLDKISISFFHRYKRGQVVVLSSPNDRKSTIIKRLIAIEGDWIKDREGNYVHIPKGHCWIEGDENDISQDSSEYGPVSLGLLQARAIAVVWPPFRFELLSAVIPANRVNCWS